MLGDEAMNQNDSDEDDEIANDLRQELRAGMELPISDVLGETLLQRDRGPGVSELQRNRLLHTIRMADVDRRLANAAREVAMSKSDFGSYLRAVRLAARMSYEELASRFLISPDRLRSTEKSARAVLGWTASALAEVLYVLNIPLHNITELVRRAPDDVFGVHKDHPRLASASIASQTEPLTSSLLEETKRILRDRGRSDLLAPP
jgi:transcriptional regulator with XRE-family HTH domain